MNDLEEYIVGQLIFYEHTRALLSSIKLVWFEDKLMRSVVDRMMIAYYNNEPIDYMSLTKGMSNTERIRVVNVGQSVAHTSNVSSYLPRLEHKYLRKVFVEQMGNINWSNDLDELLTQTQSIIDNTKFTTINDPLNINKIVNKTVDTLTDAIARGQMLTGNPTGWSQLDLILGGWNIGDLVVMAARPGQGKTALALSLMYEFAKLNGKGLFISLEMSNDQLAKRYLSLIANISNWKIRSASLKDNEVVYLCDEINKSNVEFYVDDDPNCSIQQIKSKAKIQKAKHGLQLLVIDYIQLVGGTKQNREQEIAEISRNLKLLAKELQITVIVLAQLSRKCEERTDKRPMLSDIRESGSIEQDADVVMFPFRPAYYSGEKMDVEDAELIIAKNRHGECKKIQVTFTGSRTMYEQKK